MNPFEIWVNEGDEKLTCFQLITKLTKKIDKPVNLNRMASHSKDVFIDTAQIGNHQLEGASSPFHAMAEVDEGYGISMVPVNSPSTHDDFDEGNDLKVYQGHADFDPNDIQYAQISSSKWYFGKTKRATIKYLYLGIFASIGALLRIVTAQLFGEECKNPGTVGYLAAGQPLCVTADGETSIEGGIIFADLPANLLGSFVMGLMQATDTMHLPKSFPIAWLNESNYFQTFDIIHLAIKTGFCGSVTTFSSWNSEMVMMLVGVDADRGSLFFRSILGYLIGIETALASFVLGKNIAKYFHSVFNKALEKESEEAVSKKECGMYINYQLSDYERRFLSEFDMGEHEIRIDPIASEQLKKWRISTREHRRVGNHMLPLLTDIEYTSLVLDEAVDEELLVQAMVAKWDLEALRKWREMKRNIKHRGLNPQFIEPREFRFAPAFRWTVLVFGLLLAGVIIINDGSDFSVTYRTMLYSAMFAPAGAFMRLKLSKWNGKWTRFSWFPLGTFSANLFASIISASMIAVEYRMNGAEGTFWLLGTVRAIKIGFAGCLSTVSTFICEFSSFLTSKKPIHGYIYVFTSIFCCAFTAAISYLTITFNIADEAVYYRNGQGYGY
jgi:fluoride ion exporter CrcB/FEX